MQWWYSIELDCCVWCIYSGLIPRRTNETEFPGAVCVIFFFNDRCWMWWKQLAIPIGWGVRECFYLLSRCEQPAAWPVGSLLTDISHYVLWMQQWKRIHYMQNLNPQQPDACVGVSGTIKLTSQGRAWPLPRKASITQEMEGRIRNKTALRADCRR